MKETNRDSLVIIPTYNEKENISDIIKAVLELSELFHILIVDDGSPDGTADIVKAMQELYSDRLHILERTSKLGLGTAYIAGFKYGLAQGYDYIYEMDADFSHNPKDLLRLRAACEAGADIAIGSRYIREGKIENWGFDRHVLSRGASFYVQLITRMRIQDPTAGFKCYKRVVLSALNLDRVSFIGYAFQIEMKYAAASLGFRMVEVPITFIDRVKGKSKMNLSIVKEAIVGVIQMRNQLNNDPAKYKA